MVVIAPILATKPMVNDKTLALQLCRQRIHTKTESRETRNVFIGREEYSICGKTQTDSHEVSPLWQVKSLTWGFSSGFLLFGLLICLVQSPCFVYLRILPCVRKRLLEKMRDTSRMRDTGNLSNYTCAVRLLRGQKRSDAK